VWRRPATPAQEGAVLGVAAFAVFLLTRTRDVGGDGTVFAVAVERVLEGHRPSWQFFHPHHVLYNPLVAVTTALLRFAGIRILALDGGALVSALAGAAVAGGLVVVLRRHGAGEITALLAAVAAAVSAGLWGFSTRMEVYALEALAALVWLAVVSSPRPKTATAAGSISFAVLAHIAASLLVIPTLVRFWRRPRRGVLAAGLGLAGAGVVLAAALVAGSPGMALPQRLGRIVPASGGSYLGGPSVRGAAHAVAALGAWRWYDAVAVFRPPWPRVFDGAGTVGALILLGLIVFGAATSVRRRSRLGIMAVLGFAAFVPLWLVWDVGNVEHTVVAVPFLAVLAALGAEGLPVRGGKLALGAAVVLLGVTNAVGSAIPQSRPENGRVWIEASFIRSHTDPGAILLTTGLDSRERLGLPYLSGRRIMDLTLLARAARRQSLPPTAALGPWLRAAREAPQLWVIGNLWEPGVATAIAKLGIDPAAWNAVVHRLVPVRRERLEPAGGVITGPFLLTRVWLAPVPGERRSPARLAAKPETAY